MGAIGSGRKRTHLSTSDCLTIDIMDLRGYLTGGKCYLIDDKVKCTIEKKQLEIAYTITQGEIPVHETIQLVTTSPPNVGGKRYWIQCPCCQKRVRILYISTLAIRYPTCRTCLKLTYPSQRSSAIERQITYEKYLLSNYGYSWASHKYHSLKKHYFKITPEYHYKMALSEREVELQFLKLLIRTEHTIFNTIVRSICTLKSDEDKQIYIEHVAKEHGQEYALNLVRMLQMGPEFEQLICDDVEEEVKCEPPKLQLLQEREKDLEQQIQFLKKKAA